MGQYKVSVSIPIRPEEL
jgi:hypothetical protein